MTEWKPIETAPKALQQSRSPGQRHRPQSASMTDEELRKFINVTPDQFEKIKPNITPDQRAGYEALYNCYNEIQLWESGLGPAPKNAIICGPREVRGGR